MAQNNVENIYFSHYRVGRVHRILNLFALIFCCIFSGFIYFSLILYNWIIYLILHSLLFRSLKIVECVADNIQLNVWSPCIVEMHYILCSPVNRAVVCKGVGTVWSKMGTEAAQCFVVIL